MEGIPRFLNRVWSVVLADSPLVGGKPTKEQVESLERQTHQTIKKVSKDFESFSFNTAVAALMTFTNDLIKAADTPVVAHEGWRKATETLVLMLAPIAPHISEELWERRGGGYSVHEQAWPGWDEELARPAVIEIPVQINGKVRARFKVEVDGPQETVERLALEQANVQAHLKGRAPRKIIVIPNRLVNIVV